MNNLNRLADDMPFKKNEEKYKMDTVNLNELRRIQNNNDLLIQLIRTISAAYNTSFAKIPFTLRIWIDDDDDTQRKYNMKIKKINGN